MPSWQCKWENEKEKETISAQSNAHIIIFVRDEKRGRLETGSLCIATLDWIT